MNATPATDSATTITIPRVKTRPGLIASAKTFRLVCDHDGLHVVHLGRAMGPKVKSRDPLADKLAGVMISKMEQKMEAALAATERELQGQTLSQQLTRKHSFSIPLTETASVICRDGFAGEVMLVIRAPGRKMKLIGHDRHWKEFQAIAERFAPADQRGSR